MCLTAVGDRRVRRRLTKQQAVKADVEFRHAGQNLLCDLFPLVGLPGVELGAEITLNWAYVAFGDVKRRDVREVTCCYAENVDDINAVIERAATRHQPTLPGTQSITSV